MQKKKELSLFFHMCYINIFKIFVNVQSYHQLALLEALSFITNKHSHIIVHLSLAVFELV